jgi:hypothetical protein
MKTLEKDRTHRYETAHALVEDIERHLRQEPILAGSPGAVYHVNKFLRRHRTKGPRWPPPVWPSALADHHARFNIQQTRGSHERLLVQVGDRLSGGEYRQALAEIKPILASRYVGPKARLLNARIVLELRGARAGIEQLQALLKEPAEVAANAHFLLARIYSRVIPAGSRAESHLQQASG